MRILTVLQNRFLMPTPKRQQAAGYEELYERFDSPLAQQIRREAHGKDIGQHSWVTAEELVEDVPLLGLSRTSRLLDLGCGPCGPLALVVETVQCYGTGIDISVAALAAGRARAISHGLDGLLSVQQANLDQTLPFETAAFDAVMALDVILHVRDRAALFGEVARLLRPGGRFLFTDAGVICGAISDEEISQRAMHGYTQFAPPGFNETTLEAAGFRLIDRRDRTAGLLENASGRLAARLAHRPELEQLEGVPQFERQQAYLETVVALSQRGALARIRYIGEYGAA
jgi:SAM-dependent methyltransferase